MIFVRRYLPRKTQYHTPWWESEMGRNATTGRWGVAIPITWIIILYATEWSSSHPIIQSSILLSAINIPQQSIISSVTNCHKYESVNAMIIEHLHLPLAAFQLLSLGTLPWGANNTITPPVTFTTAVGGEPNDFSSVRLFCVQRQMSRAWAKEHRYWNCGKR